MSSGPTTLVVASTGFTPLEGATVKLSLVDVAANKIEQIAPPATVSGGKFTFNLDVKSGTQYRVDLYADVDGDGHCQVGVDHVYAVDVMDLADGGSMTANVDYNSQDSRGCLSFGASSLHVTATNFSADPTGKVYRAAIIRTSGGIDVADRQGAALSSTIDFTWEGGMYPGNFYRVDLFVDMNGDTHCTVADGLIFSRASVAEPGPEVDGVVGSAPPGDIVPLMIDGVRDVNTAACASFQ